MDSTPINEQEAAALENADFFRTKAAIDIKINALFSETKLRVLQDCKSGGQARISSLLDQAGRTYRGENHHGLPWRALDALRITTRGDLLLFRVLLLWGTHFSIHLIADGKPMDLLKSLTQPQISELQEIGWRSYKGEDIWDWRTPASSLGAVEAPTSGPFRLTMLHPLSEFNQMADHSMTAWKSIKPLLFQQD